MALYLRANQLVLRLRLRVVRASAQVWYAFISQRAMEYGTGTVSRIQMCEGVRENNQESSF